MEQVEQQAGHESNANSSSFIRRRVAVEERVSTGGAAYHDFGSSHVMQRSHGEKGFDIDNETGGQEEQGCKGGGCR